MTAPPVSLSPSSTKKPIPPLVDVSCLDRARAVAHRPFRPESFIVSLSHRQRLLPYDVACEPEIPHPGDQHLRDHGDFLCLRCRCAKEARSGASSRDRFPTSRGGWWYFCLSCAECKGRLFAISCERQTTGHSSNPCCRSRQLGRQRVRFGPLQKELSHHGLPTAPAATLPTGVLSAPSRASSSASTRQPWLRAPLKPAALPPSQFPAETRASPLPRTLRPPSLSPRPAVADLPQAFSSPQGR